MSSGSRTRPSRHDRAALAPSPAQALRSLLAPSAVPPPQPGQSSPHGHGTAAHAGCTETGVHGTRGSWALGCTAHGPSAAAARGNPLLQPPSSLGTAAATSSSTCSKELRLFHGQCRITEHSGLEGISGDHPPAEAGSPTAGCRGPCPGGS